MGSTLEAVRYKCDWTDEFGDVCETTEIFSGSKHPDVARDSGWGYYTNAYVRRIRWETGVNLWFCPVHATVFKNNHGWGDLEDYGPPTRWWENIFKKK